MKMKWSEPHKPNDNISYDYVTMDSPLGEFIISWKSWKETPSYDLELDGKWLSSDWDLTQCKSGARQYLLKIQEESYQFINS